MSKLKAVWDAVNELRGDLLGSTYANTHKENYKTLDVYLHVVLTNDYEPQPIGSFVIYSSNESARGDVRFICTIAEFNALVEDMTLGLDVNPVNHGHYLNYVDADKTLLEKESEVDYTPEEFWKDAPEGATHHCGAHNGFSEVWIKDLKEDSYSFRVVGSLYASDEWRHTNTIMRDELKYLTPRPQPKPVKPVYTQEMADSGVLPSVGMKCIAESNGVVGGSYLVTVSQINDKGQFACIDENGDYLIHYPDEDKSESFKPIDTRTSKEKAIDYMNYAYNKGQSMEDVFNEIVKGYVPSVKWVGE